MKTLILIISELTLVYLALFIALSVRVRALAGYEFYSQHIMPFAVLFVVLIFVLYINGVYDRNMRHTALNIFNTLLRSVAIFSAIAIALFYFFPLLFGLTPKITFALFVVIFSPLLFVLHYYLPQILKRAAPQALLIGGPQQPHGFEITNIVPVDSPTDVILGAMRGISNGRVLMSFSNPKVRALLPELHSMMLSGVVFIDTDRLSEEDAGRVCLDKVDELWLLKYMHKIDDTALVVAKRFIDIVVTVLLMPIFIVLLPFVAAAIKLQDFGDIFIRQERVGLHGRPFLIYKFRTMTGSDSGADAVHSKLKVTKFGKFLRKSRVDELPQLINILKGELSLIGPRPEITELVKKYTENIDGYYARHIIRPGLTGWAQVTHANDPHHGVDVEATREKFSYDLYYIKNLSIFLELKIILKTVKLLLNKIFTS